MAAIDIVRLVKTYDNGYTAVKGIDLHIRDKEFMVLVGPSGCGKTTTLRMIAGLEDISRGEIRIDGKRVNETAPKNRDIAMVFQSYALYPHMTVYDNMAFALKLRGEAKPEIHAKVLEVSRMLGLDGHLGSLPKALSGGQRQRVALGRAIVRKPKAYLFDEPLSNLDAKLRATMRYELKAMQQTLATTAVYVTHDQIEAMTLGDRITVMSVGEIQQVAAPIVLYDAPFNRFVAGFIGTPAMNFLSGQLCHEAGAMRFRLANGAQIRLGMAEQGALPEHAGKPTVLGIRPEHLHPPSHADCDAVSMRVELVEHMGDHQYVYLRVQGAGEAVIMKAPPNLRFVRDEIVPVHLDTARAHIFADSSEHARNLTLPKGIAQQQ